MRLYILFIVPDINIYFEGVAKVHWTETKSRYSNGRSESYTENYHANEFYISKKLFITGEGVLPPGTHNYSFTISLPLSCPTSCVEEHGKISYEIKLNLNRLDRYENEFIKPLKVLYKNDLNLNPEYLLPLDAEGTDDFSYCCWLCSSGPIITTLTLPFSGYAPGQQIFFKLNIDNRTSSYSCERVKLKLIQIYKFTAQTPERKTRTKTNILDRFEKYDRCLRLSKRIIHGKLQIPSVPPTTQGSCIITVSYVIQMEIETSGCTINPEYTVPITIGTIPLQQSITQPNSVPYIEPTAPNAPDTPVTPDSLPGYDIFKPPSFEEAVGSSENIGDPNVDPNMRQVAWVPEYPMNANFTPPPPSYQNSEENNLVAEHTSTELRQLLNAGANAANAPSGPQGNTVLP